MSTITEGFTEDIRYDYPLNEYARVIDVGAHRGVFSKTISEKYGCLIHAYEPVFFEQAYESLKSRPNVFVFNRCVSSVGTGQHTFLHIKGDMTGEFADGDPVSVEIISIGDAIDAIGGTCNLLKLNCEAGEYPILQHLISSGEIKKCQNVQVQFHDLFPESKQQYESIRSELLKTHELTFDFGWLCWQNYRLK